MRNAWTGILGTAAVLGLAVAPALAQGPGTGHGRGQFGKGGGAQWGGDFGPPMERVVRALDLSAEQQAEFEQLRAQHRTEVQPLLEQARTLRGQVRQALDGSTPDAAAIGERVISAHRLMAQVDESRNDFEARFQGILSPEQRQTLETLKQARERMRDGEGRRGPRGARRGGPGPGSPPIPGDDPEI